MGNFFYFFCIWNANPFFGNKSRGILRGKNWGRFLCSFELILWDYFPSWKTLKKLRTKWKKYCNSFYVSLLPKMWQAAQDETKKKSHFQHLKCSLFFSSPNISFHLCCLFLDRCWVIIFFFRTQSPSIYFLVHFSYGVLLWREKKIENFYMVLLWLMIFRSFLFSSSLSKLLFLFKCNGIVKRWWFFCDFPFVAHFFDGVSC